MPVDNWLILAYIMIFSSVILCGLLPMILRLLNDRQRFHRYNLEHQAIKYSSPHVFLNSTSIYSDVQFDLDNRDFHTDDSHEHSIIYTQIPFIDDDIHV